MEVRATDTGIVLIRNQDLFAREERQFYIDAKEVPSVLSGLQVEVQKLAQTLKERAGSLQDLSLQLSGLE